MSNSRKRCVVLAIVVSVGCTGFGLWSIGNRATEQPSAHPVKAPETKPLSQGELITLDYLELGRDVLGGSIKDLETANSPHAEADQKLHRLECGFCKLKRNLQLAQDLLTRAQQTASMKETTLNQEVSAAVTEARERIGTVSKGVDCRCGPWNQSDREERQRWLLSLRDVTQKLRNLDPRPKAK